MAYADLEDLGVLVECLLDWIGLVWFLVCIVDFVLYLLHKQSKRDVSYICIWLELTAIPPQCWGGLVHIPRSQRTVLKFRSRLKRFGMVAG